MYLNFLLYEKIPFINSYYFSEFNQLSQEFDKMKDIIQMYQKLHNQSIYSTKNYELKAKIEEKSKVFKKEGQIYSQIISIFFHNINEDTYSQFLDDKSHLYVDSLNNNFEAIDLSTRKQIFQKNLSFILNIDENTASLGYSNIKNVDEIPKSIFYKTKEYKITSISSFDYQNLSHSNILDLTKHTTIQIIRRRAFINWENKEIKEILIPSSVIRIEEFAFENTTSLTKITFSEDSKLKIIEKNAFYKSAIKSLYIPSCVIELEKGWCANTPNLIDVKVMPNNKYFAIYDDKLLIQKSFVENSQFDILAFCNRDVEEVTIPSYIKRIERNAFENCKNLKKVTFSEDSNLRLIGQFAFSN